MADTYSIRRMQASEMGLAMDWAADEGWNPGLYDEEAFYAADPQGYFIGELNGRPIASISAVAYNPGYGFLGFYIVHPDFRGRGFGLRIWHEALAYVSDRNIGLDGVPAQQANYVKSGFALAYRNIRHLGAITPAPSPSSDREVVEVANLPFDLLAAYDRRHFPAPRDAFLKRWVSLPDSRAIAVVKDGAIAGYGVIRPCRIGFKVGPLFADTPIIAQRILIALTSRLAEGAQITLDVPEANAEGLELARRFSLKPVFETARMYTRRPPELPLARIFGVTTFELG